LIYSKDKKNGTILRANHHKEESAVIIKRSIQSYNCLLTSSNGKKNFANIARTAQMSRNAVKKAMGSEKENFTLLRSMAQSMFAKNKKIFVAIDETLLKKIFATLIQGTGYFFDQKTCRRITAFKLIVGMISDGKYAIPIDGDYLFDGELEYVANIKGMTKLDFLKRVVSRSQELFPDKNIVLVADGGYSSIEIVRWCRENNIDAEFRIASSCVVEYNGEKLSLQKLLLKKGIQPKGRQMARTVTTVWHDMNLEITIERRIDKHNRESFVFQVATYKAIPSDHIAAYKARWNIEKMFRTLKQRLGIQDCQSKLFQVQRNHMSASLLTYGLLQLERKNLNLKNVESVLNRSEAQKVPPLNIGLPRILHERGFVYA
jgi:hypothetical protein